MQPYLRQVFKETSQKRVGGRAKTFAYGGLISMSKQSTVSLKTGKTLKNSKIRRHKNEFPFRAELLDSGK